jgi:hypothetical protein
VARAPPSASPLLLFVAGTTTVMSTAAASDSSCVATVVLCECNDWDCAPCHILCDFVRLCLLFGVFFFSSFFKMSELYLKRLQRVYWLPIRLLLPRVARVTCSFIYVKT